MRAMSVAVVSDRIERNPFLANSCAGERAHDGRAALTAAVLR
jgi:hypothetical protein